MTTLLMSVVLNKLVAQYPVYKILSPDVIDSSKLAYIRDHVRCVDADGRTGILDPKWRITQWITKHTRIKSHAS